MPKLNGPVELPFDTASEAEIEAFLASPDAVRLTEERKVVVQMTIANLARLGCVLAAASEAVPEDKVLESLTFQMCSIVRDQISTLIRQQSAKFN